MRPKPVATILTFSLLIHIPVFAHAAGHGAIDGKFESTVQQEAQAQPMETRVYVRRQCLLGENSDTGQKEFVGVLAAIFLPILIKKVIGGASSALKKAGTDKVSRDSGRLPTYLYQMTKTVKKEKKDGKDVESDEISLALNPNLGCVIIVRGVFTGPDKAEEQSKVKFSKQGLFLKGDQEQARITRLNESGIPISTIGIEYEAAINKSNDGTAINYENRFLEVNSFQGSSDTQGVVVSIAINGAGSKEGEPTLSLAMLNLGDVKRSTITGPDSLRSRRGSWLGGLGMSDDELKVIEKIKLDANQSIPVMPVTIEATIAETEKGNKTLAFIAEVLDATKDDVTKAITSEATKDREKEAATAADAREKLRQDEENAYADYLKAKSDRAGLEPIPQNPTPAQNADRVAKDFQVEKTKRAWCLKLNALTAIGEKPKGERDSCP
jgi:hypothetical protein